MAAFIADTGLFGNEESEAMPAEGLAGRSEARPLPWRPIVATWPVEWRERWGRLANDLMDAGRPWPADEAEAYAIVGDELRDARRQEA
jgi:hypothetical protein